MTNERIAGTVLQLDPSFDAFVSGGSARLLRSAYLIIGDRAHAEDLLQVTLVRTARRWESAREAPDAYAYRVLMNLLKDRQRGLSRRVTEQPLGDQVATFAAAGDHVEAVSDRDALVRAMKLLPARQREVVVLRFFADLSVSETAAAIGSSQGSVKTHTSRALAKLREALADDDHDALTVRTEVPGAD